MKEFLEFIKKTPTAYQAVEELRKELLENGYKELFEQENWQLEKGGKYFFSRNMSSLVAFVIPEQKAKGFHITAAHLDSPTFKLKPNFTLDKGRYLKLNTEVYGSPIYSTWMDRPLGIAGRIFITEGNQIKGMPVALMKPLVVIPNLPIHYNRNVNKGVELNPQVDLLPLFGETAQGSKDLYDLIAEEYGIDRKSILSSDLYLSLLDRGCYVGANQEFIMAPQIDNLECSHALLQALMSSKVADAINVCVLFDNEEIGSATYQGAFSRLLDGALRRIAISLSYQEEEYLTMLANSFMISADNAQGYHPNYPSKYDEGNACYLNDGIVIKNAARGSYSTDAFSSACFQKICLLAGAKYQLNTNRSDILGGSTLGTISIRQVSIPSVDIGLAQLAMHSAYETAGRYDYDQLLLAIRYFYTNSIQFTEDNKIIYN